jgi:hypothetical protein
MREYIEALPETSRMCDVFTDDALSGMLDSTPHRPVASRGLSRLFPPEDSRAAGTLKDPDRRQTTTGRKKSKS